MFNGILFQQSLQDLVKGIRAHRRDEDEYIRAKVAEIGQECRSADVAKKTTGVLKLAHLQMMGHNISFASFYIVEVMSNPDFASKRIGYLAAAQSFSPTTDVLLLTTNQFKKDLRNGRLQDCSLALTCLAKLVTEELGRALEQDVSLLLNSPRPYIRKKSLLVLYRLIMVHPDTLPVVSERFRERLSDSDPGVVCAAVTVTCELARASPRSFLSLAPLLYQLLTNKESNNWMLIKIVKLMGVLTPLEPRLGKKLVEPLTTLMRTTRAKSLLYECCSTVTAGLMAHPEAVELCAQRLGEFMDESDQNLKYLGLLSMRKLIQAHPHLALEHRDNILDCLDDQDIGIRMRALELVSEFVTIRSLREISRILLRKLRKASSEGFGVEQLLHRDSGDASANIASRAYSPMADREAPYRDALARQLLRAGEYKRGKDASQTGYEILTTGDDFAWYITTILGGLAEISLLSTDTRNLIGDQLLELTSRVEAVRAISVKVALALLSERSRQSAAPTKQQAAPNPDEHTEDSAGDSVNGAPEELAEGGETGPARTNRDDSESRSSSTDLSPSLAGNAAWILGEYSELISDYPSAMETLISFPRRILDSPAQVRVLMACAKVYACSPGASAGIVQDQLSKYVDILIDSAFAEVQERACLIKAIVQETDVGSRTDMALLFAGKLKPVDHRAQSKIPVTNGLDLERSLLDLGSESLYSYLVKNIESGEDEEGVDDDSDSLFSEAVYGNNTLSLPGVGTKPAGSFSNQGALLSSLPEIDSKDQNPFYLGSSGSNTAKARSDANHVSEVSRYGYDAAQVSTDAAVVTVEENPLGLDMSDDDQAQNSERGPQVDQRLQAAFDGAFSGSKTSPQSLEPTSKRKKKKKKKKDGKERKSKKDKRETGNGENAEISLIDFDLDPAAPATASNSTSSTRPKHLADSLLM